MADLISREALLEILGSKNTAWEYGAAVRDMYEIVKAMPAVDAAPVVHARWIDHKDEHQCSACKEFTVVDAYVWMQLRYDFCPYCGAIMGGGDIDEQANP